MAISNEQAVSLDRAITASNEQMTGLYHNLRSRSEVKHAYASFKDNPLPQHMPDYYDRCMLSDVYADLQNDIRVGW